LWATCLNVALFEFVEIRSRQAWSQIVFPPVPSSNVVVLGFHIEVIISHMRRKLHFRHGCEPKVAGIEDDINVSIYLALFGIHAPWPPLKPPSPDSQNKSSTTHITAFDASLLDHTLCLSNLVCHSIILYGLLNYNILGTLFVDKISSISH
jgi:hypothetical protein